MASVSRTVAFARSVPYSVRYLGANCGRLIGQVLDDPDLDGDLRASVGAIRELLGNLDSAPPDRRTELLDQLDRALSKLLPSDLESPPFSRVEVRARLVPAEEAPPEASAAGGSASPTADADVGAEGEKAAVREGSRRGCRRRHGLAPEVKPVAAPTEPGEGQPRESEPPSYLLGDPEGTGRPLAELDRVDSALIEALDAAGITTGADLLLRAPGRHQRHPVVKVGRILPVGEPLTLRGRLFTRCTRFVPGGRRREVVLEGSDGTRVSCRWVTSAPRGWDGWTAGMELAVVGVIERTEDGWVVYEPEPVGIDGRGSGLLPCYEIDGVEERVVRDLVARLLSEHRGRIVDHLPREIVQRHRLLPLGEALCDGHFPANTSFRGRMRLAFDELFLLQVGVAWGSGATSHARGIAHRALHGTVGQLEAQHGIALQDGQEIAFSEIRRDLMRPEPMVRLLQGDVGAGKGLVALMSALVVVENQSQVAWVAPNALAAERRFLFAEPLLRSLGVAPLFAGEGLNHAQADAVRRGEAHVVFGTRSLIERAVDWRRLGLVIAEEQGPYGMIRPRDLKGKGPQPDLLAITPVPIPSSLALTVFGEYDVSVVPLIRLPRVKCRIVDASERDDAYALARDQMERGRQVYVTFPVRDGQDVLGLADARRLADALRADTFPGARVGIYSSGMSRDERARVFDDFVHRRVDVLVCAATIEDAPDVANATVMLVEYADHYDMMRLHRLRGHVAYGAWPGHCVFVLPEQPQAGALAGIERVLNERDGFRLAEYDLAERGAKALLADGTQKPPAFRWAQPLRDRELLLKARAEAFAMVRGTPGLQRQPELIRVLRARFCDWLGEKHPLPKADQRGQRPEQGGRGRRRRRRKK